jgi:hypothetical protein
MAGFWHLSSKFAGKHGANIANAQWQFGSRVVDQSRSMTALLLLGQLTQDHQEQGEAQDDPSSAEDRSENGEGPTPLPQNESDDAKHERRHRYRRGRDASQQEKEAHDVA